MGWIDATETLPEEGELVDVWLGRGVRGADCFWEMHVQGGYKAPMWHYRNGHHVWRAFNDQDITHWMPKPDGPDGETDYGI